MTTLLTHQNIIIYGAGGGIGRGVALRFRPGRGRIPHVEMTTADFTRAMAAFLASDQTSRTGTSVNFTGMVTSEG